MASRALGAAVGMALGTCALLSPPARGAAAEVIRVNGSGAALDMMKPLLRAYSASHPDARVQLDAPLGSSGAMRALLAGVLDVAVISRPVQPDEADRGARGRAYGRTPLVIVTHRGVSKRDVTTTELADIYSGKTATWPNDERIRVILRPEKDIDTKLLRSLSPQMATAEAAAHAPPWATVAVTDPEASAMVAGTPGAIGAAALTSLLVEHPALNALTLGGMEATPRHVAAGSYPLAKDFIFVTTAGTPPAALALVEFAFSAQGRAVAEQVGVLLARGGEPR